MKCPFKLNKTINADRSSKIHPIVSVKEHFGSCEYDECPFYYKDDEDVDKCARCEYDECPFYYKDDEDVDKCARCDGGPQDMI